MPVGSNEEHKPVHDAMTLHDEFFFDKIKNAILGTADKAKTAVQKANIPEKVVSAAGKAKDVAQGGAQGILGGATNTPNTAQPQPQPAQLPSVAPQPGCSITGPDPAFNYTRRIQQGEQWVCPDGWTDTGCSWQHGTALGPLQCMQPYVSTCTVPDVVDPAFSYTTRVEDGAGGWVCPSGWQDTGCGWKDGNKGPLQCRKQK